MDHQAYQRFLSSRQESVRLSIALDEFFSSDLDMEMREAYAVYLKKRLGPTVSELVLREDLHALETLRSMGWLDIHRVEDALAHARRNKRISSLIWLLQIKNMDYEYHDKTFPL